MSSPNQPPVLQAILATVVEAVMVAVSMAANQQILVRITLFVKLVKAGLNLNGYSQKAVKHKVVHMHDQKETQNLG